MFNGVLCNDPARCSGPKSAGIGVGNLIILSGSTPKVNVYSGSTDVSGTTLAMGALNSAKGLTYYVRDVNNNVMPGGTTVTLSASGASLGVAQPSSFTVPCSAIPPSPNISTNAVSGINTFPFTVTSGGTAGTGVVTLTVTTPQNVTTVYQISMTNP